METKKKLGTLSILIIALLVAANGALLYQVYVPKGSMTDMAAGGASNASLTGTTANAPNAGNLKVFRGVITNANLAPQRLEGVATTDNGCGDMGNGLVECNTDITTAQGTVNFKYRHNMDMQHCLAMAGAEKVTVDILDGSGNAEVTRP